MFTASWKSSVALSSVFFFLTSTYNSRSGATTWAEKLIVFAFTVTFLLLGVNCFFSAPVIGRVAGGFGLVTAFVRSLPFPRTLDREAYFSSPNRMRGTLRWQAVRFTLSSPVGCFDRNLRGFHFISVNPRHLLLCPPYWTFDQARLNVLGSWGLGLGYCQTAGNVIYIIG